MEISNKAFGIFCVAVVAATIYVRAQSKPAQPAVTSEVATTKPEEAPRPKARRAIPDSPLPVDTVPGIDTNTPVAIEPEVQADDQNSNEPLQPPAPPATDPQQPAEDSAVASNDAQQDLTYQDDVGQVVDNSAPVPQWQISDRDMLQVMMDAMNREQRDAFRLMWFGMGPDERQDFLDRMRGNQ